MRQASNPCVPVNSWDETAFVPVAIVSKRVLYHELSIMRQALRLGGAFCFAN